jgi:hypothetical protein
MYRTVSEIRSAFWETYPQYKSEYRVKKRQNDYSTDIRCTFCDWLDLIHSNGLISDKLADKATL